jgi:hypothetical protein
MLLRLLTPFNHTIYTLYHYSCRVRPIDGVGKTLAQSTPLWTRAGQAQDAGLPLSGGMEFDEADVQDGFKDGSLLVTVTHEMGHVLGIGEVC